MSWKKWMRCAVLALATASVAIGCAEEREPINRVQANALDKSFFVGADIKSSLDDPEFWTQATLIDVGYGASQSGLFTSTYTQGVARIKWQITEDLLLGRLTYERIADSDGKGAGKASNDGQVVVAYTISKHFDIRRSYNPSTGEELNVIEENTSDRPWYERQYFRVDWSKNLNTSAYDFDTLSLLGVFGGIEYSPLSYYVNDPQDEDAPYFDVEGGYFDVTNKAFATPGMIDLSQFGWGIKSFPACFLPNDFLGGSEPAGNCNPVEITLRQAFRRVVDTDYEPADWDGYRFQSYGGFYTDRFGYARNYGMSDDKWHRFLTRYNIWQRSHYYSDPAAMTGEVACYTPDTLDVGEDPHLDSNADGTEDRCWTVTVKTARADGLCAGLDNIDCYYEVNKAYGGSRCDTFSQKCTLPYRQREQRPLAWYYTNDSDPRFFASSEWATHDHDVAMRHAIMVARYAECMSTSRDQEFCLTGKDADGNTNTAWPVYFGQMDDHLEAKQLAKEVDDCRHGLSYIGEAGQQDFGAINSEGRERRCVELASSVASARGGSTRKLSDGVIALAKMPEQLVLCHSPVEMDDPALCAPADKRLPAGMTAAQCAAARKGHDQDTMAICRQARNVRRGDLRHHLVNVIETPQTPSPWGIYTDAQDPLTGETFSAAINVWSHVNDLWSQIVVDRMRYVKGELTTEDVTDGEYVSKWVQAADAASGNGAASRFTRAQIDQRVADFTHVDKDTLKNFTKDFDPSAYKKIRKLRGEIGNVAASIDGNSSMLPIYEARRKLVADGEVEAQLINPQMQQLAGVSKLPAEAAKQYASILRGMNPTFQKQLNLLTQNALAERGICVYNEAPAPMALTGLSDILEQKFAGACAEPGGDGGCSKYWGKLGTAGVECTDPNDASSCSEVDFDASDTAHQTFAAARAEAIRNYIARRAHYAVIVHEMGHSVGERHNFISSSDAFSYRPQYWQLRTDDGNVTDRCGCSASAKFSDQCGDFQADGSSCVGPRYFDPLDKTERDNMIWMWMHSSVMDYAGEYTQDFLGLAGYDFAAVRMFYGENVAVFADETYQIGYNLDQARADGMLDKMDSFGGILGIQPTYDGEDIHYSQYQNQYDMIQNCQPVDSASYRPAAWNDSVDGVWHPVLDGLIVSNKSGQFTKCEQQKVDYVPWQALRFPTGEAGTNGELEDVGFYRGGPSVHGASKRVRVPYGFATDRWADLGNASVYRHDNGADVYEIFDFLLTQQEVHHIFDSYRRGRQNFSVKGAAMRTLHRYNTKIRDGAKGLGLLANIYRDFALANNWVFDGGYWGFISNSFFRENILASGMVFDHFTRTLARPEVGAHYRDTNDVLVSQEDSYGNGGVEVLIPNGATGYYGNVTFGGKLVENRLSDNHGEFDSDYTINAGSYYDKIWSAYLMTESEDNFISDSRSDFVDGRYRAVSLADLFPDGFRRWLGHNLTNDEFFKGARIATTSNGTVLTDQNNFPQWPIGWTSWWGTDPKVCFPADGTTVCGIPETTAPGNFGEQMPDGMIPLESQVGWEVQKFLIAETLLYLPSNQKDYWITQLRLWQLGAESDPEFGDRIEYHNPLGKVYVAKAYGTEQVFGRTVQKGIAARVLEYANGLLADAYVVTPGPDNDGDGQPDWVIPVIDANTGTATVKWDPSMSFLDANGNAVSGIAGCNSTDSSQCPCSANRACVELQNYESVPFFLWQAVHEYHLDDPNAKGIY